MFRLKMSVLFIIGIAIGAAIGLVAYNIFFESEFGRIQQNIATDWGNVIENITATTDQAINLKSLLIQDRVKFDTTIFDEVIDLRGRLLGLNNEQWDKKTELLAKIENAMNKVIEYYNGRMDLRIKRFYFIEWGMQTTKNIENYSAAKNEYIDQVHEYNVKLKRIPYNLIAMKKKLAEIPQPEESRITTVQVATE